MDTRTRFLNTLNFKPVDRLPVIEWSPWWDKTVDRWYSEGLPVDSTAMDLPGMFDLRRYFGLDDFQWMWMRAASPELPLPPGEGKGLVTDMDSYRAIKKYLYPEEPFDKHQVAQWAAAQQRGEIVIWFYLESFFWFPRRLFGIEEHLYSFYDQPEVMHQINQDLAAYQIRTIDEFCKICPPDLIAFSEDMSYNKGPMISRALFDEFMAPYYRQVIPRVKDHGIIPLMDSDGDILDLVPWLMEVGIEGLTPLERQAGVDIVALREKYPRFKLIGAYDKMVMSKTETEMRAEFERILPVMKQGGYVVSCDHQTPPGVSLENYRLYVRLLKEYCRAAAQ